VLTNRWSVLILLFLVRSGMGLQYQLPAALSPLFIDDFGLMIADIGLLIGLYHAPGAILAFPGGAIAARLGDKRVVLGALAIMLLGELIMATSSSWPVQLMARVSAGAGGIFLNVVMTKMLTDWFAGKDTATAMAVFGNSALFGMGLALVSLPFVADMGGRLGASVVVIAYLGGALAAIALLYRPPANATISIGAQSYWPDHRALTGVLLAGGVYGLYNVALVAVFGFGPLMLTERGWSMTAAGSATSIVLWLAAFSIPAGGLLADRTGRHSWVLFGGLMAFAAVMFLSSRTDTMLPAFLVLGLVSGLPCGPIMSLAPQMLTPQTRAIGMGALFTVYYALQVAGPWFIGRIAEDRGGAQVALDLGGLCLLASTVLWLASQTVRRRLIRAS
jgi:predicted MFS family arabinose efflux permease